MNYIKKDILMNWLATHRSDEISEVAFHNLILQFGHDEDNHGLEKLIVDVDFTEIENDNANEIIEDLEDNKTSENNLNNDEDIDEN